MTGKSFALPFAFVLACALLPGSAFAQSEKTPEQTRHELHKEVETTIAHYKNTDPGIDRFFKKSAGYVVFPKVGKAGLIVGFGRGDGELFERGRVVGVATITVGTSSTSAASRAAFSIRMCCAVGTSTFPPMWPHFFSAASWSSKWTPAAPASIIALVSSNAWIGPPNPASASATIGAIHGRGEPPLPPLSLHSIWSARRSALFSRRTRAGTLFDG